MSRLLNSNACSVSTHSRPKAAEPCRQRPVYGRSVSTHSRPKAAVIGFQSPRVTRGGFNTQPPEGGWSDSQIRWLVFAVSTHSRPKAAEAQIGEINDSIDVSTHSRPKAAVDVGIRYLWRLEFQHTAARRRLAIRRRLPGMNWVSTHSRPKAAAPSCP